MSRATGLLPVLAAVALASCGEVVLEAASSNSSSGQGSSGAGGSSSAGQGGASTSVSSPASVGQGGASTTSTASSVGQGGASISSSTAGQGGSGGAGGGPLCDATDTDGDGWSPCDGDCCDAVGPVCDKPFLVNPGAYEILGNGIDDDCDPSTSDLGPPPSCSASESLSNVTGEDIARALDICRFTTVSPPLPQKTWGLLSAEQLFPDGSSPNAQELANLQSWQSAILTHFGTGGIVPHRGLTMAGLSTGRMRDEAAPDYQDPKAGTSFDTFSQPPAAYLAAHGGAFPSSGGCNGPCPSGSGAHDPVSVRLTIRVPTNAYSFSYDFRFLSAEYGTGVCSPFNDFFLALLQTAAVAIPADRNIAFDANGNPVSINNVFFQSCVPKGCFTCLEGASALAGTGLEMGASGGATSWLTTDAPVIAAEAMVLDLMIFDVSDNNVDSMVLLDNFRWNPKPSIIGQGP